MEREPTHHISVGYALSIFGFMGAHRFYFGKKFTGLLWLFTLGLFGIGWIIDLFLIPYMNKSAQFKYNDGPYNYSIAWLLLTFLGLLGLHRFYLHKPLTGILYLLTAGVFGIGIIFDFLTLNESIDELNRYPYKK